MPGGPIKVTVTGEKEMAAKFRAFAKKFPKKIEASLFKQCEKIMTRSKRDFVPVDTGALRSTGMVEKPKTTKRGTSVTLAYGGPAVDYAVEQHENLDYNHTVGGPKYLERPLNESAKTLASDIAKDLKL